MLVFAEIARRIRRGAAYRSRSQRRKSAWRSSTSPALSPEVAAKLGIGSYHRHVFLCAGDKCCTAEVGLAAWEALKQELKDRNLSLSTGPNACYRTKVAVFASVRVGRSRSSIPKERGIAK